ncbi:MAG: NTP transferase domain-containing protein [Burkholderiales bacterium]|nr:NTP transferase domain-containing protein [Burkholderiales bacterium]
MKAVIQAGGKGARLRPYTLILPKPLMPVGDLPVIETLLKWLRRNGVSETCVTVGYLGHLIRALCGDGSQWDMKIRYSEEPEPLGTVGALNLLRDHLDETFLMLNGDLITDIDLGAFTAFHKEKKSMVTVAVTTKEVKVDLGVLEASDSVVTGFREKPSLKFKVSMGVYCMEPEVLGLIPRGVPFGFDDLMHVMLGKKIPVHVYEHEGMWMDIGRPEDFIKAQEYVNQNGTILGV